MAPTELTKPRQLNRAIGQKRADRIAKQLGLKKNKTLTKRQYRLFITGRGNGGDPDSAKLAAQSVRIFTNAVGRPLVYRDAVGRPVATVLASYGLFVNDEGWLISLANTDAPTQIANTLLVKGG